MKKWWTMMIAIVALGMTAACTANQKPQSSEAATAGKTAEPAKAVYTKITQEQAKERIDSGDPVIILDVRTLEEYNQSHIPDAILIPNETIGTELPEELPDLDAEILVYCRSGNRSAQAANKLIDMGYTRVFDFGGINTWPYETVSE